MTTPSTSPGLPPDDEVLLSGAADSLVGPGGKVDADAIRRVLDQAGAADEDAELRHVTFRIRRDLEKRLDRYLTDRIAFMSRNQLQKVIREGGVLVNNRPPKPSTLIKKGDVIEVVVPPPPEKNIQPEDIPLDVLYEDDSLIVLNKRPGIIVHPARSHLKGTMLSALAYHFQRRQGMGGNLSTVGHEFARPGVVHRLDRHTSGCIVFAKQDEAHWKLGHQFEHRTVDKRYLAVVQGRIEPDTDVIDLPIGNHPSREKGYREKYVVRHDDQGRNAVTIYRVREVYDLRSGKGAKGQGGEAPNEHAGSHPTAPQPRNSAAPPDFYTLVELELKTGRTHQIRVHLSYNNWPIVGDDMYGGKPFHDAAGAVVIERQALHAAILGFDHPITGKRMVFTAPLRGDMAALVHELRARGKTERPTPPGATVDLAQALKLVD